jgi:hypothetical protein
MLKLTTVRTITETTREGSDPSCETVTRHSLEGRGMVTVGASMLSVSDPYGETDRREFTFYSDSGSVLDAIVDYVAAIHREVERASANGDLNENRSASCQLERLRRIAGAAGFPYRFGPVAAGVE